MPTRAQDDIPEPIRVQVRIEPGPHFVGQAIGLTVTARAKRDRPAIVPPRVIGATIVPEGTSLSQVAVTGIGDLAVDETTDFSARFRLVPGRPGPLSIPPFVATLERDGRSGRSPQTSLTIRDLPASGRTRTFLGGVGRLEAVEAEVSPASVRVGQPFEYRLRLAGPAARGSTASPDLSKFGDGPLGLRVEPLPVEAADDPPARMFRYRLRPSKAGEATLPSVPVAAFDPKSQTYQTRLAPGLRIRVAEVEAFDPSTIAYRPPTPMERSSRWRLVLPWIVAGTILAASASLLWWSILLRVDHSAHFARRLAAAGLPSDDAAGLAERVERGLAEYLRLAIGRPPGALTPDEARAALASDPDLADRAGRIVEVADRLRFGGAASDAETTGFRADAVALFADLARRPAGPGGRGLPPDPPISPRTEASG